MPRIAPAEPTIATTSQREESATIALEQDGSDELGLFERFAGDAVEPLRGRFRPPLAVTQRDALGERRALVECAERGKESRLHHFRLVVERAVGVVGMADA